MTSMMNIKSMTSMKSMKWMVNIRTYIECKHYVIAYFLLPYVIIIIGYLRNEGCCNDSTVIAT
jgi:hypothetical protein